MRHTRLLPSIAVVAVLTLTMVHAWPAGNDKAATSAAATRPATSQPTTSRPATTQATSAAVPPGMAIVPIKLPKPVFIGTPKNVPRSTTADKLTGKARPPLIAPKGTTNLALKKSVTSSEKEPIIGTLSLVTDGDKEAAEGSYVELGPGLQWVQIDLGAATEIYGICLWHFHADPRIYRDVVVQVADDPNFASNVRTVFSNDQDNSAGLGIGKDREYFEMYEGKLIQAKGVQARYVRLYSQGSTADDENHYIEVEVYGVPSK